MSASKRLAILSILAIAIAGFSTLTIARAQSICPPGTQPALAGDIANMIAAGIKGTGPNGSPTIGQCWSPSSTLTGTAAAQAKNYLQNAKCSGATIDTTNLNSGFAMCAQKFVQSAKAQDPNFCLTSAYRSTASQQAIVNQNAAKFGCPANTWCPAMSGSIAQPGNSYHQLGLAIDVSSKRLSYQTIWSLATAQGILNPTSLHSSDPLHIQAQSKTPGSICNSSGGQPAGSGTPTPTQAIVKAAQNLLGINSGQCQAGYTMVNGTCLQGTGGGSLLNGTSVQAYCSGNTILYQDSSGNVTAGQSCPSGCLNGICSQTQCPTGYLLSNNTCIPQQCPLGTTMNNGVCMQTQQPIQSAPQTSAPASSGSSGSAPASSVNTSGTTQSGSQITTQPVVTPTSITSPTLVSNLGTSTIDLINAFANPTPAAATPSTTTPITLSAAGQAITQLQAPNAPITYAQPASSFFPGAGQSDQSGSLQSNGNGITTTAPQGYDNGPSTDSSAAGGPAYAGGTIASTQPQKGSDTFTSADLASGAPASFSQSPSTFGGNALSILAVLKTEVINAIGFLSVYARPFGGVVPSQQVGE